MQAAADITGKELTSQELWDLFNREYLNPRMPYGYRSHQLAASTDGADSERMTLQIENAGRLETWLGQGSGPIDAMVNAIALPFDVLSYEEHSRGQGSAAKAVSYIEITTRSRRTSVRGRHAPQYHYGIAAGDCLCGQSSRRTGRFAGARRIGAHRNLGVAVDNKHAGYSLSY